MNPKERRIRSEMNYEHEKYTYLSRELSIEQIDSIIAMQNDGSLSENEADVTKYMLRILGNPLSQINEFDTWYEKQVSIAMKTPRGPIIEPGDYTGDLEENL